MKPTSSDRIDGSLVLYHAVSSYQLLEVLLHRQAVHPQDRAVLILPDFITQKYPQYRRLASRGWFDEVYLFPYLQIPHRAEEAVRQDVRRWYRQIVPHPITAFSAVYVAGAHFYFSLYLLDEQIPFVFFEDAAGMLSRADELSAALSQKFPIHAAIARRSGLFTGEHPLVRRVICLKSAQSIPVPSPRYDNFSVQEQLEQMPPDKRRRLVRLFLRRRIRTRAQAVLLTQQFAGLGAMTLEQQRRLYERLGQTVLRHVRLIIKRHPDDTLHYADIFPQAEEIRAVFPSELLPYVFARRRPELLYTFSSTGCENLTHSFTIHKIERDRYVE